MERRKYQHKDNLIFQTFVVVDFKKNLIGKFSSKELAEFFKCNFASLTAYIRKKARYSLLYYIYLESEYNKMIRDNIPPTYT